MSVALIYLPPGPGGQKVGVDDFFASGHSIDDLLKLATTEIHSNSSDRMNHGLPEINIVGRHLREISQETWDIVERANNPPKLFQRGSLIVDIKKDDKGQHVIRILDRPAFKGLLDRIADFVAPTQLGIVPARPPADVVADMMAAKDLPLPLLKGIINSPVFATSGSLVSTPGYSPLTGYYLILPKGLSIPPISDTPGIDEIKRAKSLFFDDLLVDFPLVSDADRANALSAILVYFVRQMIEGPTPLHLFESPTPGSGKGLIVDVITIPALGRGPTVMTEGRDEDEWRKRITSRLMQAPTHILIDNVRTRLDSAALSAALTSDVWEDRVLGYSRTVAIPVTCTWLATANNPGLSLEVARRTVSIRLDAVIEKPWERKGFKHKHLRRWALRNRAELIWAALTIVQAWVAAGKPPANQTLGSYESFTEVVGGILSVAEVPGFLANQDRVYAEADQEVTAWAEFCHTWWREFGERAMKAELIFGIARRHKLLLDIWSGRDDHAAHTAFGKALARMRDRVLGGLHIRRIGEDSHSKVMTYRLEPTSTPGEGGYAGDAGVGGGSSDPKNVYEADMDQRSEKSPPATIPEPSTEKSPQPQTPASPRNPRDDPWDRFLDEVEDGTGRANSKG